jgi:hypothetical protein
MVVRATDDASTFIHLSQANVNVVTEAKVKVAINGFGRIGTSTSFSHPHNARDKDCASIDAPRSVIDVDAGFRTDANATGRWKRADATHGIFVPSNPRAFVVVVVVAGAFDRVRRRRCVQYPHPRTRRASIGGVIRRGSRWWGHVDGSRMVDWTDFVRRHVWLGDTPILFTHTHCFFLCGLSHDDNYS